MAGAGSTFPNVAVDHYTILGVSNVASAQDIRQAYLKLVRKHHPDALGSGDNNAFLTLQNAYKTLGTEDTRRQYDARVKLEILRKESLTRSAGTTGYSPFNRPPPPQDDFPTPRFEYRRPSLYNEERSTKSSFLSRFPSPVSTPTSDHSFWVNPWYTSYDGMTTREERERGDRVGRASKRVLEKERKARFAAASKRALEKRRAEEKIREWEREIEALKEIIQREAERKKECILERIRILESPLRSKEVEVPEDQNMRALPGQADTTPESQNSVRVFEIPCRLENASAKALGDSAAKRNFMKEQFAIGLGLKINRGLTSKVKVGSGKEITTRGQVTAAFRFEGERKAYTLTFHLLPDCLHDIILGKTFLGVTQTLTNLSNFCRRIKERIIGGITESHFLYLGASGLAFEGSVNNQPQTALADSGAKVMVMDEAYARSIGVAIQTGKEHRCRLRFADNSTAWTEGMAYGVEWKYGREGESSLPYVVDFHVLRNAPASVILCDTFLFDTMAFSRYSSCLVDDDDDDDDWDDDPDLYCFAIDKDTGKTITKALSIEDLQYFELVRRGDEEDRISSLPVGEQETARDQENQRRAQWEQMLEALRTGQQQAPHTIFSMAASQVRLSNSSGSSMTSSQASASGSRRRNRFKWNVNLWSRRLGSNPVATTPTV